MRLLLAALLALASPGIAGTDPIIIEDIDWGNCLGLMSQFIVGYEEEGLSYSESKKSEDVQTTVLFIQREMIILRCDKTTEPVMFSLQASPL